MLYDEFKAISEKHESDADDFATIGEYAKSLQIIAVLYLAQVDHIIENNPMNCTTAFKAGEAAAKMEVAAQLLHHFADVQADAKSDGPMDPMSDLDDIINSLRGGTAPERGTKNECTGIC